MKKINIKSIKPINDQILVEAVRYPKDQKLEQNGLLLDLKTMDNIVKLYQKVIAVGSVVREVKPGDYVMINHLNYLVHEYEEDVDTVRDVVKPRNTKTKFMLPLYQLVDGTEVALINQRDVKFVFTPGDTVDEDI